MLRFLKLTADEAVADELNNPFSQIESEHVVPPAGLYRSITDSDCSVTLVSGASAGLEESGYDLLARRICSGAYIALAHLEKSGKDLGKQASASSGNVASSLGMRFSYSSSPGPFVRRMNGTVEDARGLWNALLPLQPPPGAHGGYGLIGDDRLLGGPPGFGLSQLGRIARRYIVFDSIYVAQPSGWESIGVQSGVFTSADQMNDTSLGWAFFDLRGSFENDLKLHLNLAQ
jgi:hypothetical protein